MISTRDLSELPSIERMRQLAQVIALLDAILSPDWEYRYFSFNANWRPQEMMASMRDGSGDDYFMLFTDAGAILKGFAHESAMSPYHTQPPQPWPDLFAGVPSQFAAFLAEPAFAIEDTTFCIWRTNTDARWQCGPMRFPPGSDPDGSVGLLWMFDDKPETYHEWAEEYYERPVDLAAVRVVYAYQPLTPQIVAALNSDLTMADLRADLDEIHYPYQPL